MMSDPEALLHVLEVAGFAREAAMLRALPPGDRWEAHAAFLGLVLSAKAPAVDFGGRFIRDICAQALLAWGRATGTPIAHAPPGHSFAITRCAPEGCICVNCELGRLRDLGFGGFTDLLCEADDKRSALLQVRSCCRALPSLTPAMASLRERASAIVERLAVHEGLGLEVDG